MCSAERIEILRELKGGRRRRKEGVMDCDVLINRLRFGCCRDGSGAGSSSTTTESSPTRLTNM